MEAHQAANEQLATELVLLGRRQGVVQQEGVADGLVDDAVEDVCEEFSLYVVIW